MPTPRLDEIEDRLGEMELALPGLLERRPAAAKYLARELDELIAECAESSSHWAAALSRARKLEGQLWQSPTGC